MLVQLGTDVTIINKAGHDAVFEAELNDKNDVVDWLLGAVEALEQGIGHTESNVDGSHEGDNSDRIVEGSAGSVEDMTKQMEEINTDRKASQGD
jgi:hypothetical protein